MLINYITHYVVHILYCILDSHTSTYVNTLVLSVLHLALPREEGHSPRELVLIDVPQLFAAFSN